MPDFSDVAGHEAAKRALQIAAAGNHGVLMSGPPGSGKSMLASRLPSILPPLEENEALETALVHSVAGERMAAVLAGNRPFRSPHHSASLAGLVGGGSPPRPGEISLAHNGVLFLDELPGVQARRAAEPAPALGGRPGLHHACRRERRRSPPGSCWWRPANPCPCGYFGDRERPCTCTLPQMRTYQARIGGPLMDRIDLHLDVQRAFAARGDGHRRRHVVGRAARGGAARPRVRGMAPCAGRGGRGGEASRRRGGRRVALGARAIMPPVGRRRCVLGRRGGRASFERARHHAHARRGAHHRRHGRVACGRQAPPVRGARVPLAGGRGSVCRGGGWRFAAANAVGVSTDAKTRPRMRKGKP